MKIFRAKKHRNSNVKCSRNYRPYSRVIKTSSNHYWEDDSVNYSLDPKYRVVEYPSKEADELLSDKYNDKSYKVSKGILT